MIRFAIFAVLLVGTGYACVELGKRGARAIEHLLADRVMTGLTALELDWARLRADGLRLELSGHAPDVFAQDLALETARATAPQALIIDHTTVSLAPPPRREPIAVEILRDERGLTLTGRFHGVDMQAEMVGALRSLAPELEVYDLTGVNAARPGRKWGPELTIAALAAARVPNAYVRLAPGEVQIDGSVNDSAHREAVALELLGLAGDTVNVILRLSEPVGVVAPYVFAAVKDTSGGFRLEACAARDAEEQARIQATLNSHPFATGATRCPLGLGGPSGDWAEAVAAGLDALQTLPAGRFRLEYHTAALEATEPSGAVEFESALAALAARLPAGYGLTGGLADAANGAPAASPAPVYWMRMQSDGETVEISGVVPDPSAAQVIVSYASARFGTGNVQRSLRLAETTAPDGWEAAALVALDGLSRVPPGSAELTPTRIAVTGQVATAGESRSLHALMEGEAPSGYAVATSVTVDLPSQVAVVPPNAERCVKLLSDRVRANPIAFDPGSAVFAKGSGRILDGLAQVLARCDKGVVEIGGHTDSQGSEDLNQRLSRARADAVLDALLARGVTLARLRARGYGEAEPVASNETETGRALNRRIVFRVVE
ncbi:MAG: OmpA family protein [Paracoccaceae bacterium]|nr:OmpA family protein [Paracoccaceae bacterium]